MMPFPFTFAVRDLQRQYKKIINQAKASREPVVLLNKSRPEAVLLDLETYNDLVRDDYPFDQEQTKRLVEAARRSYRKGRAKKLQSWNELDS